jgi:hypothetical protein
MVTSRSHFEGATGSSMVELCRMLYVLYIVLETTCTDTHADSLQGNAAVLYFLQKKIFMSYFPCMT